MNSSRKNENESDWKSEGKVLAAPTGVAASGRLLFSSNAARVRLRADPSLPDLVQGHFARHIPYFQAQDGTVTIHYHRFPFLEWLARGRNSLAHIALNAALPWEIEFAGGISELEADLSKLQLRSLDVRGGASRVTLVLAPAVGTGFIYVAGGASKLTIQRPPGTGVRLQIGGGATNLRLDNQKFGAIGGETRLESADFNSAGGRYDICIAGGASNVTIG